MYKQWGSRCANHSSRLAVEGARKACADTTGPVDILVNNAGAIRGGGLFDISMDDWRESWELKVFGYLHMCQLYGELMKQQKSGIIVNIIGLAGRDLRPDYICGSAGNAALIAFTQALGAELQKKISGFLASTPLLQKQIVSKACIASAQRSKFGDPKKKWSIKHICPSGGCLKKSPVLLPYAVRIVYNIFLAQSLIWMADRAGFRGKLQNG